MPDWVFEEQALRDFGGPVAGIDEVGRGPLAGPVLAAAVVLDEGRIPEGLDDSKKLSRAKREILFEEILQKARAVCLGQASVAEIDALNIREAALLAMARAGQNLAVRAKIFLIDGRDVPKPFAGHGRAIVKGDSLSVSIAAASIVAKVARDRQMRRAGALFPEYGFEAHAGYGTARHIEAIKKFGPCVIHRRSFSPISKFFSS